MYLQTKKRQIFHDITKVVLHHQYSGLSADVCIMIWTYQANHLSFNGLNVIQYYIISKYFKTMERAQVKALCKAKMIANYLLNR